MKSRINDMPCCGVVVVEVEVVVALPIHKLFQYQRWRTLRAASYRSKHKMSQCNMTLNNFNLANGERP